MFVVVAPAPFNCEWNHVFDLWNQQVQSRGELQVISQKKAFPKEKLAAGRDDRRLMGEPDKILFSEPMLKSKCVECGEE